MTHVSYFGVEYDTRTIAVFDQSGFRNHTQLTI